MAPGSAKASIASHSSSENGHCSAVSEQLSALSGGGEIESHNALLFWRVLLKLAKLQPKYNEFFNITGDGVYKHLY